MKRFSKLLVLALSLVLIATVFTVVALATDAEPTRSDPYVRSVVGAWENQEDGAYFGTGSAKVNEINTSGARPAYVYTEVSADGNKFGVWTVNPGKGNTGDMWYITTGGLPSGNITREYTDANGETKTKTINKYNLADYPYVAYDFDIMSPTGNFGINKALSSFSFRTYAYHHVNNEYNYSNNTAGAVKDTGKTALDVPISVVYSGLDDTPYNWQHVSIIARAYQDGASIKFEIKVYVNGKYADGTTTTASTQYFNNKLLEDIVFSYVRQSAQKTTSSGKPLVDFTGYVGSDPTTWPDSDPSEWYEDKVAFDNPSFANYQADWDFDAIAKDTWARNKDNVPAKSEKSVASLTKADGTITYFADVNAAIAAAAVGEKVTLLADITTTVKIDKAIVVDAGMHYKYGSKDYLLGTHDFPHYSDNGMIAAFDEATGVYTFAEREGLYTIEWDPECEGACDCPDGYKHIFNFTATAAEGMPIFSVLGEKQSEFEIISGLDVDFLGWSLTKGGEIVDLSTLAPKAGETIKLYPIYDATQYNLQSITAAGVVSYYMGDQLATAISNAGNNGTVKLMTDIYTECGTVTFSVNITIDLNGHTLDRCFVYGNEYEATPDGAGGYVYGTAATAVANAPHFFQAGTKNVKLEITGPGAIKTVSLKADTWKCDGEVVKRTAISTMGSVFLNTAEKGGIQLHITNGAEVYSAQLFYQTYASGGNYVVNIDNAKFVHVDPDNYFSTGSGAYKYVIVLLNDNANTITVTDSILCFPYNEKGANFISLRTNGSGGDSTKRDTVYFKNSDLIRPSGYGWSVDILTDNDGEFIDIVWDNCRVFDVTYSDGFTNKESRTHNAINGSMYRYHTTTQESPQSTDANHEVVAKNFTFTYDVPNVNKFTINNDSDINYLNMNLGTKKYSFTFTHIITKAVDVNYEDANGNVIKTEQLRPGVDALNVPTVSYALDSDPYRNILAQWVDENGNALGTTLGLDGVHVNWQDSYTFRSIKPTENIQYTGGLKDIFFNISFNSNFRYNLYLPAEDENLTVNSISGFTKGNAVMIDGNAYYVYTLDVGTTAAANNTEAVLNFTANGVTYEQTLKLNALLYADIILATGDVEEEKLAIGNMARFIMEACKVSGVEIDEERFNAIISDAGVNDYAENYDGDGNITTLSDYIYSVNYVIYQGNAYYKFVLKDASYADLIKFTKDGKEIAFTVENGTDVILDNARVYDIIDTLTITVGDKSATYSMLDNIEANPDSDLLKALYEFGLAAENYRAYIEALTE